MGVNTKSFDNASDMITFSRASGGYGLTKISYGPELVTNGTFDSDTSGWTATATVVSWSNGVLRATDTDGAIGYINQNVALKLGKVYLVTCDIVTNSMTGNTTIQLGTSIGSGQLGAVVVPSGVTGTFSFVSFAATTTTGRLGVRNASAVANDFWEIDNISVKEVTYNSSAADATLQLIYHPNDVPRIEYNTDGTAKGLLVEESRTNLVTYSDVDTTNWTDLGFANISTESVSNPFGLSSVVKVVPTTDTTGSAPKRSVQKSINVTTGTTYTYSAFVKAAGYNAAYIIFTDRPNVYGGVAYDLSTASLIELDGANLGTLSNPFIEDFGDGWYRIGFSHDGGGAIDASNGVGVGFVPTGLASTVNYSQSSFAGDGVSGGYVAGVQVEAGSFPTSYIKTTGATATRSLDEASIPLADFGFNTGAGTFVAEFDFVDPENDDANYVVGGLSNARVIYNNAGNSLWQTFDGNAAITFGELDNTGASRFKAAVGVKTGKDAVTALDGAVIASSTSATDLMVNLTSTNIITFGGGSANQKLNGHIKSIKYYPRRLTDAQLQELTT